MTEKLVERRLAAVLAADVVGYSRLMERDEADTRARLRSLRSGLVDPVILEHGGRIVSSSGDGILVEFSSAVNAVHGALAIQTGVTERAAGLPEDQKIVFRIGINVGDVIIEGDDIHGDGVNVAARLEGLCSPGCVYVSGSIFDQVSGKSEVTFEDLGEQNVKNITRPVRVYRARQTSAASDKILASVEPLQVPDKPSIAVLPFVNMSGIPEEDFLGDGIAEDIITGLSRIRSFFVIARNSTFQYKGTSPDIRRVAADLGVRYVVEGSVRKAGSRVRATVQLIDGGSGNHLWAERWDRDLDDFFVIQDEITGAIIAQLEPELGRAEYERVKLLPPDNLDAWELYHRGMANYQKWTKEGNLEARRMFKLAAAQDDSFAAAHAGIAWTYAQERVYSGSGSIMTKAVKHAQKAVALDDKDAFAHVALGRACHLNGDPEAGKAECDLALRINPSSSTAYSILGLIHLNLRNAAQAVSCIEQSIRLSPFDPEIGIFQGRLAGANFAAANYESTLALAKTSIRNWNHWIPQTLIVASLGYLDRGEEARQEIEKLETIKQGVCIEFFRANWPPHHPDYIDHIMEGLRKAGVPEKLA